MSPIETERMRKLAIRRAMTAVRGCSEEGEMRMMGRGGLKGLDAEKAERAEEIGKGELPWEVREAWEELMGNELGTPEECREFSRGLIRQSAMRLGSGGRDTSALRFVNGAEIVSRMVRGYVAQLNDKTMARVKEIEGGVKLAAEAVKRSEGENAKLRAENEALRRDIEEARGLVVLDG